MEKKKSQKDAVFEIALEVLGKLYSPDKPMRQHFNSQMRDQAVEIFVEKVNSGEIKRPKNCDWEHDLKTYAKRIVLDRLNRDRRLNGNVKYVPRRYSIEKTINSDRIIADFRREIYDIKTKLVPSRWVRNTKTLKVLKEDLEITNTDRKKIKKLENKIKERRDTLENYGEYLPEVARCLNSPQTIAYIELLASLNKKEDCFLVIEAFIHHILTYTEPVKTHKEEKNAS